MTMTPEFAKEATATLKNVRLRSELLRRLYGERNMYENAASDVAMAAIHVESWIVEEPNRDDLRLMLELLEGRETELYERSRRANDERKRIETRGTEVIFCDGCEKRHFVVSEGEDPVDSLWHFSKRYDGWYCPECAAWNGCATCEEECGDPPEGLILPLCCPFCREGDNKEAEDGNDDRVHDEGHR